MPGKIVAQVVPLRRLPPALSEFSYLVPTNFAEQLKVGQVARIPFKNSEIFGLVVELSDQVKKTDGLKTIAELTSIKLTAKQIELAKKLANYYYQSLALIVNSFLAQPPRRQYPAFDQTRSAAPRIKKRPVKLSKAIQRGYLFFSHYDDIFRYIVGLLSKVTADGQIVIIVPELKIRRQLYVVLSQYLSPDQVVNLPSKQKKNEYLRAFEQCRSARVVIGSEIALLMPFKTLAQIIVVEAEHHIFQSAEQNPRYHLADYIFLAAKLYSTDLLLTGFSPDVTLLHQVRKLKQPIISIGMAGANIEVIDMNEEPSTRSKSLLAYRAQLAIEQSSGKVLLIYNRHGDARYLICKDCGFKALCRRCEKPYIFDSAANRLTCLACDQHHDVYLSCPNCQGTKLFYRGIGAPALAKRIQEEFPERTIALVTAKKEVDWQQINRSDMVIATNKIFSAGDIEFDISVMMQPDLDLHLTNSHAAESLRHYIMKLASFSKSVYVQTKSPTHYVYSSLGIISEFYQQEIDWRKKFSYPPFSKVITVTISNNDKVEYEKILQQMLDHFSGIQYIGPIPSRSKSKYLASIFIKQRRGQPNHKLDELLRNSYNFFRVEINPYQII